jgi:ATP-dependent Lon protease
VTGMDPAQLKALFGDRIVNKGLAQQGSFSRLPRYVAEYIVAKYVHEETAESDLERIKDQIRRRFPDPDQREVIKNELLRAGHYTLIDRVEARVDLREESRWAVIPSLGEDRVRLDGRIADANPKLLAGGSWGTVELGYRPEVDEKNPLEVTGFTAFQVNVTGLQDYIAGRARFTSDEWIDLLLGSVGYEPSYFPARRTKLLLLSRLVPLLERNVNLIELGPRQTGKTFLLRNTSPEVFVVSGGKATPATLFINLARGEIGIIGSRKVVVFDEIANTSFDDVEATVSVLKDFMESGQFSRGKQSFTSEASLLLCGNIDVDGDQPLSSYRHLFEVLPKPLIDTAFLDRLHGYLPGWEIPKITRDALSVADGFVIDYLGAVFVRLRNDEFRDAVHALEFNRALTQRDLVAIERITAGLLKLLYPGGDFTTAELAELATLAVEYRQRVHDQLVKLAPGEFRPKRIAFEGMPA